jgi:hypothetical protein
MVARLLEVVLTLLFATTLASATVAVGRRVWREARGH